MFNIQLKEVHIGQEIDKRREELNMSKSEFGRLIGVPQQHVNRIFENVSIDTVKLISEGLEESKPLLIDQINGLKDQISQLKSQLDDKNELINIYKQRVNQ